MSAIFISEERSVLPREKLVLVYWGSDVGAPAMFGVTETAYKLLGLYRAAMGAYLSIDIDQVSRKRDAKRDLMFALSRLRSEVRKDPTYVDWYSELFQTACHTVGADPVSMVQVLNACHILDRLV